jgi:hypothetical protein
MAAQFMMTAVGPAGQVAHVFLRGDVQLVILDGKQLPQRFRFHRREYQAVRRAADQQLHHLLSEQSVGPDDQHPFGGHASRPRSHAEAADPVGHRLLQVSRLR